VNIESTVADAALTKPVSSDAKAIPLSRLVVVNYHLHGRPVRTPSTEVGSFQAHVHGWLYRIGCGDERQPTEPEQRMAPFGAWLLASDRLAAFGSRGAVCRSLCEVRAFLRRWGVDAEEVDG
jgi:hypothetical protein